MITSKSYVVKFSEANLTVTYFCSTDDVELRYWGGLVGLPLEREPLLRLASLLREIAESCDDETKIGWQAWVSEDGCITRTAYGPLPTGPVTTKYGDRYGQSTESELDAINKAK